MKVEFLVEPCTEAAMLVMIWFNCVAQSMKRLQSGLSVNCTERGVANEQST
jgi:hypothetical protein